MVNASLIPAIGKHAGVKIVSLELTKIAADMGSLRSANMLAFGLCTGLLGLKNGERLKGLLGEILGKKNPAMLEVNERILEKGVELGREAAGRVGWDKQRPTMLFRGSWWTALRLSHPTPLFSPRPLQLLSQVVGQILPEPGCDSTSRAISARSLIRLLCLRVGSPYAFIFPRSVSSSEATRKRMP